MIENIKLANFLAFTGEIEIDFCKGANIFIGENGTGKTSLLKILYEFCKSANEFLFSNGLSETFGPDNILFSFGRDLYSIDIQSSKKSFSVKFMTNSITHLKGFEVDIIPAIFIPTKEMLSHSRGFVSLYEKYKLSFDDSQIDILKNAQLPETRELTPMAEKLLPLVSEVIDGEVVYENDTFYVVKTNGMQLVFSLEAEGLRKFGMVWKLLRNGLFDEPGTVLFWDEPEANLNPILIPKLVDVLLELQRNGVQMFLATHEYNLARYFDLKRDKKEEVMFHNLYKKDAGNIYCDSSHIYQDLNKNSIEKADGELGDFIIEKALEELDNV